MEFHPYLYPRVQHFPDYAVTLTLEGVLLFYTDKYGPKVYHDWIYTLIKEKTDFWNTLIKDCQDYKEDLTMDTIKFNDPLLTSPGIVQLKYFFDLLFLFTM